MPRTAVFLNAGADLSAAVGAAHRADALGYESVWVTHGAGRDALLVLSGYAQVAPRVGLGTGSSPSIRAIPCCSPRRRSPSPMRPAGGCASGSA